MKKWMLLLCMTVIGLMLVACGSNQKSDKNLEGTLEEIMNKVYEGVPQDQLPAVSNAPITAEMSEAFLGKGVTSDRYKEAQTGDAMINAVAHSVCLVRANSIDDVEALKADIQANADPAKWICTVADKVIVDNIGDVVILIMSDEATAKSVHESFLNLNK